MYNPFCLTFGMVPQNYIRRIKNTNTIIEEFSTPNPSNFVYVITGLRGSGKTVLLTSVASHFSTLDDWIVVDPGPKDNILENITSEIYENGKVKKLFLKTEFNFSFHGISFKIEGDEPVSSLITILKRMLDHLKAKNKKVLITIDEVDNSEQMKLFIQAYQSLIRQSYQVFLLMTGLYENIYKLQDDKALTFLYRAPKINLGPLSINSIAMSYKKLLNIEENEALKLANLTKGYAYGYQVLGYLIYKNNKKELTDDILQEFDEYLKDYVYDKLFSELSNKEQDILLSINSNQETKTATIINECNIDHRTFSVYRDRLLKKGIISSPTYGYIEFTLPRFNEFLNNKRNFYY